jgi:hypothetical protein
VTIPVSRDKQPLLAFEDIPKRVFLDTNVINVLVKHSDQVFDGCAILDKTDPTRASDIDALRKIFFVGARANWDILGSQKTIEEIMRTTDPDLRDRLLDYALEIINRELDDKDRRFASDFSRRIVDSHFMAALPDRADRELVGHAIGYGCDAFCTCDRSTIVSKRDRMKSLGLRILVPAEWWAHIQPWAALWC